VERFRRLLEIEKAHDSFPPGAAGHAAPPIMTEMKRERRSYYRILYVQPEAPLEVIRASYRSLMTKLKMHPDLGGDHDAAVAINQAYAVLSDPEKRRAYDAARKGAHKRVSGGTPAPTTRRRPGCPFCGSAMPPVIAHDSHCARCSSPLAPIASRLDGKPELVGRRNATRIAKQDFASVQPAWNQATSTARLRDLSTAGVSFYTAAAISVGSNIRLKTPYIDLVATVVQVRSKGQIHVVQARILTARFANQSGV
jgi:hypothetical protein